MHRIHVEGLKGSTSGRKRLLMASYLDKRNSNAHSNETALAITRKEIVKDAGENSKRCRLWTTRAFISCGFQHRFPDLLAALKKGAHDADVLTIAEIQDGVFPKKRCAIFHFKSSSNCFLVRFQDEESCKGSSCCGTFRPFFVIRMCACVKAFRWEHQVSSRQRMIFEEGTGSNCSEMGHEQV